MAVFGVAMQLARAAQHPRSEKFTGGGNFERPSEEMLDIKMS
jgi:hypothetical protein